VNTRTGSITINELAELMSPPFRPFRDLFDRCEGEAASLGWFRVSAFPKYATTYDELVEWIDKVPPQTLDAYRDRFGELLKTLAIECPTYVHQRRYVKTDRVMPLQPTEENLKHLVTELAEEDASDFFVPAKAVALIGHDDFGCNCFFDLDNNDAEAWIRGKVAAAGLFCVRPEKSNERAI
jgi:hypothetical protein